MALLGHASAEMSLRYGRLFDTTVRAECERALDLAKQQARTPPAGRTALPLADITSGKDLKDTAGQVQARRLLLPARARLGCLHLRQHLRALPQLRRGGKLPAGPGRQRADAAALAQDAWKRGWITEADRHKALISRLGALISQAQAG